MGDFVTELEWQNHLQMKRPFLDVRAPIEFAHGSIPQSLNLPILNDEERESVGTCYKNQGPEMAVELGMRLVSGAVKEERIANWVSAISRDTLLYCFRGGMRSAITQKWLKDAGVSIKRIDGGYKRVRNFLLESIPQSVAAIRFVTLGGHTGSGKTRLLRQLRLKSDTIVDLEDLSRHRGSAFGEELDPQPSLADFENRLAVELLRLRGLRVWWEDEARTIGKITLSDAVFDKLRSGPLVLIEESQVSRAELIRQEYVTEQFELLMTRYQEDEAWRVLRERLITPINRIAKKLGGVRTQHATELIQNAIWESRRNGNWESHREWILYLLENYYDPYYENHAQRQSHRVVFRGTREEVAGYFVAQQDLEST